MTNTKNCDSKNSMKNKTTDTKQNVAVNKTTTDTEESSVKDTHTLSETPSVAPDGSERRDGPGGD